MNTVRASVIGDAVRVDLADGRDARSSTVSHVVSELSARLPDAAAERLRRADAPTRCAVAAVHAALAAACDGARVPGERVVLWVSLVGGCEAADRAFWATACDSGGAFASPQAFAATLPSALAGDVALILALRGPVVVATSRTEAGVPDAAFALAAGSADVVVHVTVRDAGEEASGGPRADAVAVPATARPHDGLLAPDAEAPGRG